MWHYFTGPDVIARLRAAMAERLVAVVPERARSGEVERIGWCRPGLRADHGHDGRRQGSALEYADTVRVTTVEAAGPMDDLGYCAFIILGITSIALI